MGVKLVTCSSLIIMKISMHEFTTPREISFAKYSTCFELIIQMGKFYCNKYPLTLYSYYAIMFLSIPEGVSVATVIIDGVDVAPAD